MFCFRFPIRYVDHTESAVLARAARCSNRSHRNPSVLGAMWNSARVHPGGDRGVWSASVRVFECHEDRWLHRRRVLPRAKKEQGIIMKVLLSFLLLAAAQGVPRPD